MKKTFKLFVALFFIAMVVDSMAQDPSFKCSIRNIHTNPDIINGVDSTLDFDIYVMDVSPGAHDPFNYGAGQYWANFNLGIGNGLPTDLAIRKTGSDLPVANQCPSFIIQVQSGQGRFGCSPNIPANNNIIVPNVSPGIKVLSLRITSTTLPTWNNVPPSFAWRSATPNPYTKIAYFLPGGTQVREIPVGPTNIYDVETNDPLPVELASFTSVVNRNNVTLNWSTANETNNAGFDIERKAANSTQWSKVGNVSGNGTTHETKSYTFSDRPSTGSYSYRLKQIDFNGNSEYFTLSNEVVVGVPSSYAMSQNYPNPFNPTTKIDFDLPYDGKVSIVLFDISGREVGTLVNDVKTAGYYTVQFNASNLASGMYFYRISAQGTNNNFVQTKKMVLIK